jgi:UDP-N-acetylmuramoyl-tripeptide--D-alanyl-D-alanine ligase
MYENIREIAGCMKAGIKGRGPDLKRKRYFNITIDTRVIKPGDIFFALKGEHADGHDYVEQAFKQGAAACVVSLKKRIKRKGRGLLLCVNNPRHALWDLARYYRSILRVTVVAVTGSNGKTTCKDMIGAILGKSGRVLVSQGSFNNDLGVPLTLLRARAENKIVVVELGTNHFGEISRLSRLVRPDVGVITSIGESHLEFFKTVRNIVRAKSEIADGMNGDSTLIVNGDSPYLKNGLRRFKGTLLTFGMGAENLFRLRSLSSRNRGISFRLGKEYFRLDIPGKYNAYNATAAVCVARVLGIRRDTIRKRLSAFRPSSLRMEVIRRGGITILNDCYNANPVSMKGALQTLVEIKKSGRSIGVLGDMLELGEKSKNLHREIGRCHTSGLDRLFTVGPMAMEIYKSGVKAGLPKIYCSHFERIQELIQRLLCTVKSGDVILIKGSRGMKMEAVTGSLLEFFKKGRIS